MARNKFDVDETLETPFSFSHLKRAKIYVKKHSRQMIIALISSILAVIFALFVPILTSYAIDSSIPNKKIPELIFLCVLALILIISSIILSTYRSKIMTKVGQEIIYEIRRDLFDHLQRLPFQYYDDRPHGKILVRVVHYANNVSDMLSNGIINFILEIINLLFILIFMFILDFQLALIVIAGVPIFLAIVIAIKPVQRRSWQQVSNKNSNLTAYLHESLDGAKITQAFVREKENAKIYDNLNKKATKSWMKAQYTSNLIWYSVENITVFVTAFIYIAAVLWIKPTVSVGIIIAMTSYASRFWQPIINLSNLYNSFINSIAYLERIFETLDEPVSIKDCENAKVLPEINGNVKFDDVTFSYDGTKNVLENLDFEVNAGESVALVGPTGAGKTTVVNLISRFYDVNKGAVLIDGEDISKVTLKSLRSQMGIMLQDSFIFSGTILDNIKYGKFDATEDEVIKACKTVCADEFISEMENGYKTEVNERGSRLSQGQKQLISFARTLLANPKILILDEATSSIDAKTEKLLQQGLNELLKGRTSFIIAHRLSTIKNCDKIMYVADKGIKECGTHNELMAKKGYYYNLYTSQLKEVSK